MMHEQPSPHDSLATLLPRQRPQPVGWQAAHDALSRLARSRARLDWEEGTSLLDALRSGAHIHLGFGSFGEYVERLFGYSPRWTLERLRVAEALEDLPELAQSLRDGVMNWSALRELTRVATAENEHAWLEAARSRTLRQIEQLVAGHKPGDHPDDASDPSLRRHALRFEVSGETLATFREAMAQVRRDAGGPIDDDAALLILARQMLGGPADAGRANYQVALMVCEQCGRGWQEGKGDAVEVGPEIVEMAACDAQHIGRLHRSPAPATHVGEEPAAKSVRARQDIPPAVRREVTRRDGGRCVVPGCKNAVFLDVHHVVPRSEGGDHDPDRLVLLCGAHHRAQHRGQLVVAGRVSTGLVFRHADGTRYGARVDAHAAAAHEEAFRALRGLGFREGQVRIALDRLRSAPEFAGATTERILRGALGALTTLC
jgi:hypothetical protein